MEKLIFTIPLWLIITMAALECRRLYLQGGTQAKLLLSVIVTGGGWAFFYSLELIAPSPFWAFLWARISYFFIATLPACWLLFAISMAGKKYYLSGGTSTFLFFPPAVAITAVWTNDRHFLFWEKIEFTETSGVFLFEPVYGTIFHVFNIYAQTLSAWGFCYLLIACISSRALTFKERVLLCFLPVIPMAANTIYIQGVAPAGLANIDLTPYSFLVAMAGISFGNFHRKISKVTLLAREKILETLPDATFLTDGDGAILDLNQPAKELMQQLAVNNPSAGVIFDHVPGLQKSEELECDSSIIAFPTSDHGNDVLRTFRVQEKSIKDSQAYEIARVLTFGDITPLKAAEEKARSLAYYDQLTKLPNRHFCHETLNKNIETAKRRGSSLAVFIFDLDGFKDINDSLGHDQGDIYMQEVARRLANTTREGEFVARFGGDEFCLIAEDVAEAPEAEAIALRALEKISQSIRLMEHEIQPQVSIGIAMFPDDGDTASLILKAADSAMYTAKRSGGHSFAFYHQQMTLEAQTRLRLDQQMRQAINNRDFNVVYQPIVSVDTGICNCTEALARWRSPDGRDVSPLEFVPALERLGLVSALGEIVLERVLAQAEQWQAMGIPPVGLHINIEASQLADSNFIASIADIIADASIDPALLTLEITETSIQTTEDYLESLQELKKIGVNLALDDFGTGYSSLASLKHLPLNTLKIDRSLITDLERSEKDRYLVESLCRLSRQLGFETVAEGVETRTQLKVLEQMQCDLIQGFIFSHPLEAEEFGAYMRQQTAENSSTRSHQKQEDDREQTPLAIFPYGQPLFDR